MSIGKIEQEIQNIKKDFSEIVPDKTAKTETSDKKRSYSTVWVALAVIVVAVVVLVIVFLLTR